VSNCASDHKGFGFFPTITSLQLHGAKGEKRLG